MNTIYQGEEKPVFLDLTSADGQPLDLEVFTRMVLYIIVNRRLQQRYVWPAEEGTPLLTPDTGQAGRLVFTITSAESRNWPAGQGTFELSLHKAEGEKVSKVSGQLFQVTEANTRHE